MGFFSIRSEGGTWGMRRVTLELPRFERAIVAVEATTKYDVEQGKRNLLHWLQRRNLLAIMYTSSGGQVYDLTEY